MIYGSHNFKRRIRKQNKKANNALLGSRSALRKAKKIGMAGFGFTAQKNIGSAAITSFPKI